MAIRASVTVSIAEDSSGTRTVTLRVTREVVSTSLGTTSLASGQQQHVVVGQAHEGERVAGAARVTGQGHRRVAHWSTLTWAPPGRAGAPPPGTPVGAVYVGPGAPPDACPGRAASAPVGQLGA